MGVKMDTLSAVLAEIAPDWEAGTYGDTVISPNGWEIELDGESPDGEVSPLRAQGLI